MALHLIKLSVGPASIADLAARQTAYRAREGTAAHPVHVTRTLPKRHRDIAGKGSLYWVIKGSLCCRQAILALEPLTGEDGIPRCRIVLDERLVPVTPRPCRPFQGWRYLSAADAPADLGEGQAGDLAEMPEALRRELASLGLL
ncbi:DUF1489 family protein [Methylobacterium sp. J-076]|uniref:DUF1489 family protein n=1 Tax=Methylobacterium sp. J-076 TaxID=2836655 RepID=UPI001FBAE944|nr:DUF1489 domain-containing protein [Methylobacterium sp. J-076]MCJ2014387.1 DUF1489 domain-containing protein [Methylobacterium sp. J-076]